MKVLQSAINTDMLCSKKHKHSCIEIVYRINGESHTTVGDQTYNVSRGDMYFLPPDTIHYDYSEEGFSDLVIHIESSEFTAPLFFHDNNGCAEKLAFMISEIINKKEDNYQSIANSLAHALLQYANRFLYTKNYDWKVERLKNTIFENIENSDFDICAEIKNMGYNTDYMRRRFKAQTQKTPNNYLTELRIERAKQLLVMPTYDSIGVISAKCGFQDPFYFSSCFKKHTGLSPLQYRKQNMSEYANIKQE